MPGHLQVDQQWLLSQLPNLDNLQILASGGQKQVFSAIHETDGEVVIKIMHPGSDLERIKRELVASSGIPARRIPHIFDFGNISTNTGSIFWFREQRIPGIALNDRIRSGRLSNHEILRLALHVSETLVAAESVNIVHRDVKPANIIMDSQGEYWLIDFGLARHLDLESLTATMAPGGCGTPGYAPIEQCRNDKSEIDSRADLFALGVTLYEAATGINPHIFGTRDLFEIMRRTSTQNLPRLGSDFSKGLSDLVATLSQPQIIHRCQTAIEANEWIKELCIEEGVQ